MRIGNGYIGVILLPIGIGISFCASLGSAERRPAEPAHRTGLPSQHTIGSTVSRVYPSYAAPCKHRCRAVCFRAAAALAHRHTRGRHMPSFWGLEGSFCRDSSEGVGRAAAGAVQHGTVENVTRGHIFAVCGRRPTEPVAFGANADSRGRGD